MNGLNVGLLMQPGQLSPSLDDMTDEQKKFMRLSLLSNAFQNLSNLGQGRPQESFIPGMIAMSSMFGKQNKEKKTAQQIQEAMKGAITPSVPEQYKVRGQTFGNEADANNAAAPYNTAVGGYGGGLTSGLDSMTGQGTPSQFNMQNVNIPQSQVDYTPATPGGFDMSKAIQAFMASGNPELMTTGIEMYSKLMPEAAKPQLVDIYDPKLGKTVKRWIKPGESSGVDVGLAAPEKGNMSSLGQLIAEREALAPNDPRRTAYDQAIVKASTHQPAVSVQNYGSPVAVTNPATGQPEYAQFGNKGGQPVFTGVKPAPKEKSFSEGQKKQIIGVKNLQNAVTEYTNELAQWNKLDAISPSKRASMGTKYNNMMLQAKEAFNLGVLNGPDFEILQRVVTDPRTLTGAITPNDALARQANELSRIMGAVGETVKNLGDNQDSNEKPAISDLWGQ